MPNKDGSPTRDEALASLTSGDVDETPDNEYIEGKEENVDPKAVDATASEKKPAGDKTQPKKGATDPLDMELPPDVLERYPKGIKTLRDFMSYADNLNVLRGKHGNETGELRRELDSLRAELGKVTGSLTKGDDEQRIAAEREELMKRLDEDPISAVREMSKQTIESLLNEKLHPILERISALDDERLSEKNAAQYDSFVKENAIDEGTASQLNEIIEKRKRTYTNNPDYPDAQSILQDALDILHGRMYREGKKKDAVETEKRTKVVTRSSGAPAQTGDEDAPSEEDVRRLFRQG